MKTTLLETISEELRSLGLELQQGAGEYRINYRYGTAATEYQTDDLFEALERGRVMASNPPPRPDPPLGPTGPKSPWKACMYAHNKRDAAKRWKRAEEKKKEKG